MYTLIRDPVMTKHFQTSFLASFAAISLSATLAQASDLKRVKTEADFRANVVDRKFTSGNGDWIIIASDGTISGSLNKQKAVGDWNWQGKYWHRHVNIGGTSLGSDSQEVHISATQMRTKRKKGKGDWAPIFTKQ